MERFLCLVLMVALAFVGCVHTTTTYPDGRVVEEERIDPDFVTAFVGLSQVAMQLAVAESDTPTEPSDPDSPPLLADAARLECIANEVQDILSDGLSGDDWDRLRALYEETNAILRRQNVNVKLKVRK